LVTKFSKRNSFFNFFTPPKTVREWILDPKKAALMEAHFEIGLFFKETFVSKAIVYYANHSVKNLGEDEASPAFVSTRKSYPTKQQQSGKAKKSTNLVNRPDSSLSQVSSTGEAAAAGDKLVAENATISIRCKPLPEAQPFYVRN
jgi:hypothetical protein